MKSKTKIGKQLTKKTSSELVETIILSKKNPAWIRVAEILSGSRRKSRSFNLSEINDKSSEGETIVVPGKVLSEGEIEKKIKIVARDFSDKAKEKLLKTKTPISIILDEIKTNPEGKGIKILIEK
ncbi:MAG: 50S ribosomal protein L18e [Nanoarchaeota archaeon]|nr:50S ribosomal protein L18e [Nanoarchaeota archaeon]